VSPRLGCLFLCILLIAALPALADPVIVNGNFGAVLISCSGDYAYQSTDGCGNQSQDFNSAPGFGWTLGPGNPQYSGPGLTGPNTAFDPPPFTGLPFTQAVFLQQNNSTVSQDIAGFSTGTYTLTFYLGSRYRGGCCDGNQTVEALIDGNVIGTWALTSDTPFTLETAVFTVGAGDDHSLEFMGTKAGDHTAFLSDVSITPGAPVPEPASLGLIVTCLLGGLARWYRR
jgi:hypothetical protein